MKRKLKARCPDGGAGNHISRPAAPKESIFSAWMEKYLINRVPEAFEDELGFHYGPKSRPPHRSSWPRRMPKLSKISIQLALLI